MNNYEREPGLYNHVTNNIKISWNDLVKNGDICVNNGVLISCDESLKGDLVVSDKVGIIGEAAFYNCQYLDSINLHKNIREIRQNAFDGCISLLSFTVPEKVNVINKNAFKSCLRLSYIALTGQIQSIGRGAFEECASLNSISLPDSVKRIKAGAFALCDSLQVIRMPVGIKKIEDRVFYGCRKLEYIHMPDTVMEIAPFAFARCDNLNDIDFGGTEDTWARIKLNNNTIPNHTRITFSQRGRSLDEIIKGMLANSSNNENSVLSENNEIEK